LYGVEWLTKVYRYIQEDRAENYRVLMSFAPLARTPDSKKGSESMKNYAKSVERMLDGMTPWNKKGPGRRATLRGGSKVQPGTIMVVLDGSDSPKDPLYSGAKITRE